MSPAVSMKPSACCMMTWKIRHNQQLNCDYWYPLITIIIIVNVIVIIIVIVIVTVIITIYSAQPWYWLVN